MPSKDYTNSTDRMFIRSLARGLTILEAFDSNRSRLTLTELVQATGMNMAAVQRCTHTLLSLGYLQRDRHKEFFLGPRVLALGYSFLQGSDLRSLAEPILRDFSERIGWTVNLSVLEDLDVYVLYRHEVQRFFKFDVQAGSKLPGYCTSMGKVLLASLSDEELAKRLDRIIFEKITPYTPTNRGALKKELIQVRKNGYSRADREASLALYSISAPILDKNGTTVAAVGVSLTWGEHVVRLAQETLPDLMRHSERISKMLGYQGVYPIILPGRP